ncbi:MULTISPECIES: DUF4843 domain-containing protein [Sanguibacteroides]|uniref:Uncharacterized protein n=1 Tax=Sanguibacteroides justesenii TaxID=1547597 RepID=A0A0C3M8J3_9PORP|nr:MULTISPECIES: DUF4843 domain-containing protein [Sanguibacteroides]KIO42758.1 hypothetical protein BA92_12845 [Sanguibacteroides justesenii]PXZ44075.1 DUF4843 domain-containing protein [Sanguibacteroides justesenii]
MKTCILSILLISMGWLISCEKQNIEAFHGRRQIYFEKFYMDAVYPGTAEADSTVTSFFLYPEGTSQIKAKVVVNLSGDSLTSDLTFGLRVIKEGTTANPNEYVLDDFYTFHAKPLNKAKEIKDTIEIKLNSSDRLEGLGATGLRLMVELVPNEQLDLGQYERRRAIIIWSYVEAQPDWWDKEVSFELLGDYSPRKYQLFLKHADKNGEMEEFIKNSPDKAIALVVTFKQWLADNANDPEYGAEYQEILESLKI